MSEQIVMHPTFGVGTIISIRTDEDGRKIATCRFNDPPGKDRKSHGVIPTAQIILEAE
jgi:hypothetical protein